MEYSGNVLGVTGPVVRIVNRAKNWVDVAT